MPSGKSLPAVAAQIDDEEADVLAYFDFPKVHRVKPHSTNTPPERLNKEVKLQSDVVGSSLTRKVTRLLGAVLAEQNEGWRLQNRYMPKQSIPETDQGANDNDVIDVTASQRITQALPGRKAGSGFTPP